MTENLLDWGDPPPKPLGVKKSSLVAKIFRVSSFVILLICFPLLARAEEASLFETKPEKDPSGRMGRLMEAFSRHQGKKPEGWEQMVAELKKLPPVEQVKEAHRRINAQIRYADDLGNEWKAPVESFAKGGDCEDYAIAKMILLTDAGFPEEALRVVTLAPANSESPYHVVLVADTGKGHRLMDSPERKQSKEAIPLGDYREKVRAVVWSGWRGGFTMSGQDMEGHAATRVASPMDGRKSGKKFKSGAPNVWGKFDLPLFPHSVSSGVSQSPSLPYTNPMPSYNPPSSYSSRPAPANSAPLVVRDAAMGGPKPLPSFMTGIPPY